MRISLGLRVLSLVGTINLAVFGAGLYFLSQGLERERQAQQERFAPKVGQNLTKWISDQGDLTVAQILKWPYWDSVADAVIVDRNPSGVSLNPVGIMNRDTFFDRERIEAALVLAAERQAPLESAGGLALPVIDRYGKPWGGCWVRIVEDENATPIWLRLLPWFVASTFLLFFGTSEVLRRYVLRPVGALALGVRQVRHGEFGAPVQAPRHTDELTDLIGTFNRMSADVRGFNEYLENEADAAKEKAFQAESAALRQRRLAAMGELAAGIAHEINNPLGGMLNAVEVLDRADIDGEKRLRYHGLLRDGLERIQGTVSKLLRFTPRPQEDLSLMDLRRPLEDAVALIRHRADSQGVDLVVDFPETAVEIMGQPSEMGQAALNLLVNALDAIEVLAEERSETDNAVEVRVQLTLEGDSCVVSFLDNGPGIPEEHMERVADLFYTTKDVGRGTGLGLALVHNVIARHGGSLHMNNRQTGGLQVDLRFPLLSQDGTVS